MGHAEPGPLVLCLLLLCLHATCIAAASCTRIGHLRTCAAAGQVCYVPDPAVPEDYLCTCEDGYGAGEQMPATVCKQMTRPTPLDECDECGRTASQTVSGTEGLGRAVNVFPTMSLDECVAECENDVRCSQFTHYVDGAEGVKSGVAGCVKGVTCCVIMDQSSSERVKVGATFAKKEYAPCHYNVLLMIGACTGLSPPQVCDDPDWNTGNNWECHCAPGQTGAPTPLTGATCYTDACDAVNTAVCEEKGQTCVDADPGQMDGWVCLCGDGTFGVGVTGVAMQCVTPAAPATTDECDKCVEIAEVRQVGKVLNGPSAMDIAGMDLLECQTECNNNEKCKGFDFYEKWTGAMSNVCVKGVSCCQILEMLPPVGPTSIPGTAFGTKAAAACAVGVCTGGQTCFDVDQERPNTWECHCPPPATATNALAPADCAADECQANYYQCNAGGDMQQCEDTDLTAAMTWVCVCTGGARRGAALGMAATCRDLSPPREQDECQQCAEEVVEVARGRMLSGGRIDTFNDVSLDECMAECQNTQTCRYFAFSEAAGFDAAGCISGISCCVLKAAPTATFISVEPDAVFGEKRTYDGPCAKDDPYAPDVCAAAQQECIDPNKADVGDWVCRCKDDPSITKAVDVVDACPIDECAMTGSPGDPSQVCSNANQVCDDPDEAAVGDWLCLCTEAGKAGAAVGAAAVCTTLATVDINECEVCGKVGKVEETGKTWSAPYLSFVMGVTKEQCFQHCIGFMGCEAVTYINAVPRKYSPANPDCVVGTSCCGMYDGTRGPLIPLPEGMAAIMEDAEPCHKAAGGVGVCDADMQSCVDPNRATAPDWVCHCPAAPASASLAPANCPDPNECVDHGAVCHAEDQLCDDPDMTMTGDWMCSCKAPQVGMGRAAKAECKDLTAAPDIDECEECAREAAVTEPGKAMTGGAVRYLTGVTEDQCIQECTHASDCKKFSFTAMVAPGSPSTCVAGASCCAIHDASATLTAATGTKSGEKVALSNCHNGQCPAAAQDCADPDRRAPNDWECRCRVPLTGTPQPLDLATCVGDECALHKAVCLGTCHAKPPDDGAGQTCRDPTPDEAGTWICECQEPEYGAGLAGAAVCAEPAARIETDECEMCAKEAVESADGADRAFQGAFVKYSVGLKDQSMCARECTNTPGCTGFTWVPNLRKTDDTRGWSCVRGASCCALKDDAALVMDDANPVNGARSGRNVAVAPCYMGDCPPAMQECRDPDMTTDRNWRCECPMSRISAALKPADCDTPVPPTPAPATARHLPRQAPRPRLLSRQAPRPRLRPRQAPRPRLLSRQAPRPRHLPRQAPRPRHLPRQAPRPRLLSRQAPRPRLRPRQARRRRRRPLLLRPLPRPRHAPRLRPHLAPLLRHLLRLRQAR
eukprot:TRINITY_DN841_c0_g3_i3.p1 TRINITY_DN841_c0_g3~~TRINITY_DN841_c0_g3_i3.p1  ORF type:complete len:1386 (+),score=204.11 TRINITY_DN841_c0_g3_i3:58-4215(+)